ncbi:MAG: alpha-amylase/alpha-mannosidase (GH57 family) [Myxococcota bacterium]|jgi:alpha-amylase/alpha-mannosidase (GH57 family)
MTGARLAVLWHLHQPDYRDPLTGRPTMPWVRMHALRGYRDLFVELAEEDVAMTVNVVPSLLDQLLHYAAGGGDDHLDLVVVPASDLTPAQAQRAAAELPGGHEAMARPHPSWWSLRRRVLGGDGLSTQDLRDLQVWSVLQWFGATACRDHEAIDALRARGHGYSEADKAMLLDVQRRVLVALPDQLRRLVSATEPALSTSPYFHPILPLLVDARHARRCMPDLPDEVEFAFPEDAMRQLVDARERVEALTGSAPMGLWPSEGSVSPEVVEIAAAAGFRWLASDGDVLERSDRSHARRSGGWDLGHDMIGFFRDHELSDRVGFRYATARPDDAARDLLGAVAERAPGGVLTVALDGENPWEAFEDAGAGFRQALYRGLRDGQVRAVTLDVAAREPTVGRVKRLHTGSWIRADFHIWIGHPTDRAAWRMLAAVRRAVQRCGSEAHRDAAMPHVLAAEGSDWTWWYGEDFSTPYARHFDALFRAHVAAAWRAIGVAVPASVGRPLCGIDEAVSPPTGFISPRLSADPTWWAWQGAGQLRFPEGAMARGGRSVRGVRFGWDRDSTLWLWVELSGAAAEAQIQLRVGGVDLEVPDWRGATADIGGVAAAHTGSGIVVRASVARRCSIRLGIGDHRWGPAEVERPRNPDLAWWTA